MTHSLKYEGGRHFDYEYAHEGMENFYLSIPSRFIYANETSTDLGQHYTLVKEHLGKILVNMERIRGRIGRPISHREREEAERPPNKTTWNLELAERVDRLRKVWKEHLAMLDGWESVYKRENQGLRSLSGWVDN